MINRALRALTFPNLIVFTRASKFFGIVSATDIIIGPSVKGKPVVSSISLILTLLVSGMGGVTSCCCLVLSSFASFCRLEGGGSSVAIIRLSGKYKNGREIFLAKICTASIHVGSKRRFQEGRSLFATEGLNNFDRKISALQWMLWSVRNNPATRES